MKKVLLFEGAGWEKADHNGVGNIRIRTRILNNEGRLIYLEMHSMKLDDKNRKRYNVDYDFMGFVTHCFYEDVEEDKKMSYSKELRDIENFKYKYTKESILKFVNGNLNCSYTDLQVINDNTLRVHNTFEALC